MLNGLIDYNRTFGQHTIGVTFGMEGQKKQYEETWAFRQGFISDSKPELSLGGEEGQSARGYSWKETRLNYFGRASYNYLERYLFEFVWRVDGSYRFPKESRYGFFPGVLLKKIGGKIISALSITSNCVVQFLRQVTMHW